MNQDLEALIKKNKIEEAITFIEEHYPLSNTDMQVLKIKLLYKINDRRNALLFSSKDEFLSNPKIQYERVLLLKACGKYKTAISVCDKFILNDSFVLQKIDILFKMDDLATSFRLANKDEYVKNPLIQMKKKELYKLVDSKLLNYDKYPDNMDLQIEKAKFLRRAGLFSKLSNMCNNTKYHYNEKIISQKIEMLKEMGLYDKALQEVNKSEYINMSYIQSQKINILIELKDYYKALDVTNRDIFRDNPIIQSQKVSILIHLDRIEEARELYEDAKKRMDISISKEALDILSNKKIKASSKSILTELLTRLYSNKIDLDIINNSDISDFEKVILTIAYYDKYNKKYASYFIKQEKDKYKDKELKILNQLLQEVSSKKNTIFNISKYEKILNAFVKLSLIDNLDYQVKEETQIKEEPIKKELPKVEIIETPEKIKETKYIVSIGKKVSARNKNKNININSTVVKEDKPVILVKDVLADEVEEVGKYIYGVLAYVDTTYVSKVMKAFDIFEAMSYKEATKENIDKMLKLFETDTFKRRFNFNVSEAKIRKFVK